MADIGEWRNLLLTMRDAIYVDTLDEKAIVAIQTTPAFLPLFEVAAGDDGDMELSLNTSVALGFGYSEDMPTTSQRPVGMSDALMLCMSR